MASAYEQLREFLMLPTLRQVEVGRELGMLHSVFPPLFREPATSLAIPKAVIEYAKEIGVVDQLLEIAHEYYVAFAARR